MDTYSASLAGTNVVRSTGFEARIAHEDGRLDLAQGCSRESGCRVVVSFVGVTTATECVVEDLTTLRVANKDKLGVRTFAIEVVDGGGNRIDAINDGISIANAATAALATAGRIVDGL